MVRQGGGGGVAEWSKGRAAVLRCLGKNVQNSFILAYHDSVVSNDLQQRVSAGRFVCMVRQRGGGGGVAEWSKGRVTGGGQCLSSE